MSQTLEAGVAPPPASPDERVARRSALARLLTRPEVGALLGAIVIYLVFFSVAPPFRDVNSLATILYVSSTYGIPTVAVALLMIGGEFDLSAGVAVTASALFASMFSLPVQHQHVGRRGAVARLRAGGRVHQRLSGGEDRDTQLPRHPRHVLHAARTEPGDHQAGHRQRRHRRRVEHPGLRLGPEGVRLVVQPRRRQHPHHGHLVDRVRGDRRPGCCCAPTSATGSSPPAGRRRARGPSASR